MGLGVKIDHPFIHACTDRFGRRRYYFRRKGYPRAPLPGLPGSPEFMAAYKAAGQRDARVEPSETIKRGSFKALCFEYENSAEFARLGKLTRREMGYVIKKLELEHGAKPVELLERKHILRWRDEIKDKPGAANKMIRVVKALMAFALERGYRADNPTMGIKMLKIGEWRPWTLEEMQAFEERHPLGTLERTGYALARYTGQRRADLAKLTFKSIAGNAFKLTQGKTGKVLEIPIHPELKAALAAVHPRHDAAILAKHGRALNVIYFGHLMARAIDAAGLPDECVLHGLCKVNMTALIDSGCTPGEAGAFTGRSPRMVEHYSKRRDQVKLGKAAMLKWKRAGTNREGG